jgi:prepilin-type N-terminal cleavage/methylation domain-containing protein
MDVQKRRSAYTLLEMMAAMAVVLIVAAASVPSVQGFFGTFKVNGAVDSVRAAWAQARGRAIEEGRPYRFSIIPDTGYYRLAPDDSSWWSGNGGDQEGTLIEESLPAGVVFRLGDSSGPACADGAHNFTDPPPSTAGPEAYSYPIVFNPDGTTSQDAEIAFAMKGSAGVTLTLRRWTGAVTVRQPTNGAR